LRGEKEGKKSNERGKTVDWAELKLDQRKPFKRKKKKKD